MPRSTLCMLVLLVGVTAGRTRGDTPADRALRPYTPPAAPTAAAWPASKLVAFMRELTDFVYENHTVTDPDRLVYGMVYEFWHEGRKIQAFSLDAMHDGAWFTSAMATAHRVDPEGGYLERVQRYQVPFYVNVISNSDRLFAQRMRRGWGKISEPVKGWVPRGWDDGLGYDLGTRKRFADEFEHQNSDEASFVRTDGKLVYTYWTPSNHLSQDLSNAMLNVWLTTRDPQVSEAAMHVQTCRLKDFGHIPVVEFAAGLTTGRRGLYEKHRVGGGPGSRRR